MVTSGTALTVLERRAGHLRVRTSGGVEGWISEVYATSELPAQRRLEQMQLEHERLQQELAQLRDSRSESDALAAQLTARVEALQAENNRLRSLTAELQAQDSAYDWLYYALALIALFALGVYLGVRWDKERVAQRLGGLEL